MQGGQLDGGPGDLDRLHVAEGGDPAGPAHVDPDVQELGGGLLRRVLERDRPPGRPAGGPETTLQRDLVDLDHHAVDLVLDGVPLLAVPLDVGPDRLEVGHDLVALAGGQAEGLELLVGLGLALHLEAGAGADAVHQQTQRAGGGDAGVLLPQRPRRGVARVGERRLAGLDLRGVDLGEGGHREVDLAAHLDELGDVAGELLRHVGPGGHVGGDVLAGDAVAAGGRADQPAALVDQVDGQPVDLELAQVAGAGGAVPVGARGPRRQLVGVEGVVQALHALEVGDRGERRAEAAVDLLAGRLRGDQGRVLGLQGLELAHQLVVLAVADLRGVLHVVREGQPVELLGQLGVPVAGALGDLGDVGALLGCTDLGGGDVVLTAHVQDASRHPRHPQSGSRYLAASRTCARAPRA
ncbi:unannotated protein [freshwater metagenome]|uniref:Unannotated protein n=1 Tax=freshwater metagenome TaxID=449393 RepID=A0A6J7GP35_9ZZZZ